MTHDELLGRIDNAQKFFVSHFLGESTCTSALRAVVELHPQIERGTPFEDGNRYGVTIYMCGKCNVPYPCEDIQAIEKELE